MTAMPSPRRDEILELAYDYVCANGLTGVSLRPVAEAVGSSTGVLRFLFTSKEGLVAALLERARRDELELLESVPADGDLTTVALAIWSWLSAPAHRGLLVLWTESYAASLQDETGPWASFARDTVQDWLHVLAQAQPGRTRRSAHATAVRTAVLALMRGAMLDLLATADRARTTRAVRTGLDALAT